jgi:Protein of unknown function (DUF2628)
VKLGEKVRGVSGPKGLIGLRDKVETIAPGQRYRSRAPGDKPSGDQGLVLQRSPQGKPAIDGAGRAAQNQRRFGRLRSSLTPASPTTAVKGEAGLQTSPQAALPVADAPPLMVPIDSARTFVGPNGTYYDERWRWMEWRGRNRSWNWSAALTFGGWFAYRRLYVLATLYLGWIGLLMLLLMHGASLPFAAVVHLAMAIIVGLYANRLYQARFRRAAWKVAQRHDEHAARLGALASLGGVDRRAVWLMALVGIGLAGLLIGLDG